MSDGLLRRTARFGGLGRPSGRAGVPFRVHFRIAQKAAVNEKSKTRNHSSGDKSVVNQGTVWVRDGDFVRPLSVTLGLTDGISTELIGGEVPDGTEVVVGIASNDDEIGASPFIPQIKNDKVKK